MHSGQMIKNALKAKKGTQLDLATAIGCDQSLISRYFSGTIEVSLGLLVAMIKHLEINIIEATTIVEQLRGDKYARAVAKLRTRYNQK